MRLSLAVIAKDEKSQIERIIKDYSSYFDELCFAIDDQKVIDELTPLLSEKVKFFKYEWCNDFSHKRNFLRDKLTGDYYVRLDTDDEIVGIDKLRPLAEKAHQMNVNMVLIPYFYSSDEFGNTNALHYRESIIRVTPMLSWKKKIHENLIPLDPTNNRVVLDDSMSIKHNVTPEHLEESNRRNLKYLIDEWQENKDKTDPRTLAYLGRVMFSMGEFDKSIFFLERHIQGSGWDEDRHLSWCTLAEIFKQRGDYKQAIAAAMEALEERPDNPEGYLKLHDIYFDRSNWEKALHWGELAMSKKMPNTLIPIDPSMYTWRLWLSMSFCHLQLGNFDKACKLFFMAKEVAPGLPYIKENESMFIDAVEQKAFAENFFKLASYIKAKHPSQLQKLLDSLPDPLLRNEKVASIKLAFDRPKKWDEKSVVLFCGQTLEEWAAPSVIKGIGGSEEAVIYMSRELTKLGYKVTVFGSCGEMMGEYEGVDYRPFYLFNTNDDFNIVISWRCNVFQENVKAKKRIIWLHDVPYENQFTAHETVDKIIVLSQFHKSLLSKYIPEEKIYVSANGINVKDFDLDIKPERDPHRMIYTSSYDRGIEHLLKRWKEVKEAVPDAELHLFYGWHTYDALVGQGGRDKEYKDRISELMKQDGITEHGRVGHKELVNEFYKSGVYVYPCHFEEISCISAMKAQACGCYPVTTDYAALKETVKTGTKITGKAGDPETDGLFIGALIKELKANHTDTPCDYDFSWSRIAKEWDAYLLNGHGKDIPISNDV